MRKDVMNLLLADKANLVIRGMLLQPNRKWVARDFETECGVGRAHAAEVMSSLRAKGFIGGIRSGRHAYNELQNQEELLSEWLKFYRFELNETYLYYSPDKDILSRLKKHFTSGRYALTLHTGANLITGYVNAPAIYCYLPAEDFKRISLELRQALDLKELKKGGNVYLVKPYYKKAAFMNTREINGYTVVSDLQLYLDLFNFPQRGRDHAEYLHKTLKEEGRSLV